MYDKMSGQMYWPHLENDGYVTVKDYRSSASMRGTRFNRQRYLKLFLTCGTLEFVAMDVMEQLSKMDSGNTFVLLMRDR